MFNPRSKIRILCFAGMLLFKAGFAFSQPDNGSGSSFPPEAQFDNASPESDSGGINEESGLGEFPPEEALNPYAGEPDQGTGMTQPPSPASASPEPAAGTPEPSLAKKKISLDIKGMNVIDVLKIISQRSGLNIIAGRNVSGQVTMFIKDVEPMDALEIILAASGLAYEKKGSIINVMTARDYELIHGDKFGDTKQLLTIKPKYAKAQSLSRALMGIKSVLGKVAADESSNTLILWDSPDKLAQMEEIIKKSDQPIVTEVVKVQYATADEIKALIQDRITKNVGSVNVDPRSNKLVVTDYAENMAEIRRIIAKFDERPQQVLIEAKILQITLNEEFKFGINWDYWIKSKFNYTQSFAPGGATGFFNLGELASRTVDGSTVTRGQVKNLGDYSVLVDMLNTLGKTKILATPRVIVLNNQEATILIGDKQAYIEQTTYISDASGTRSDSNNVKFVDTGIKLFVIPTISEEGYVTMKIKPEVSSAEYKPITANGLTNEIPIVATSQAETTVMVKDGATIIIAGLIKGEVKRNNSKLPFFSDFPLLGALFKQTSNKDSKTELVIILTPTIVGGDDGIKYDGHFETYGVGEMQKAALEKPADFYARSSPEFDDFQEYSEYVSNKISSRAGQKAGKNYVPGKVVVEFELFSNGELSRLPRVVSSTNTVLNAIAVQNVSDASPFPPFYGLSDKRKELFRIAITY